MISEHDRAVILRCAKGYGASSILLFGSSIGAEGEPSDIDLGVDGVRPELFFKFYADLIKYLSKPVDLVDLSKKSSFNELIRENGIQIYG